MIRFPRPFASRYSRYIGCVLLAFAAHAFAGDAVSSVRPLQTELIGPLDLSHVHVGSSVLVRVDLGWTGPKCALRPGSIVQGHIVQLVKRSKTEKDSEVELVFDAADCNGHPGTPQPLTLVALVGPVGGASPTGQSGVSEAPPLADAVGLSIGGGLRSASTASAINDNFLRHGAYHRGFCQDRSLIFARSSSVSARASTARRSSPVPAIMFGWNAEPA